MSLSNEFEISAVFCGKKVILAAQEMLSLLDLMNIHRLTDNDKPSSRPPPPLPLPLLSSLVRLFLASHRPVKKPGYSHDMTEQNSTYSDADRANSGCKSDQTLSDYYKTANFNIRVPKSM